MVGLFTGHGGVDAVDHNGGDVLCIAGEGVVYSCLRAIRPSCVDLGGVAIDRCGYSGAVSGELVTALGNQTNFANVFMSGNKRGIIVYVFPASRGNVPPLNTVFDVIPLFGRILPIDILVLAVIIQLISRASN